ncbi:hypothetical protein AB0I28_34290 [Phytomonospora sp. NPDC050363]|uniref:hypothetical protein n=1 Tax=Phytomonospora sp. NPDC050363 TaxID=3155642 RepID=UPI0033E5872B
MALVVDWAKIAAAHVEEPGGGICADCRRPHPCPAARMADRTLRDMRELQREARS